MTTRDLSLGASLLLVGAVLGLGGYLATVLDRLVHGVVAGRGWGWRRALGAPLAEGWELLAQQVVTTERPDAVTWTLAPTAYGALAAAALSVVPVARGWAVADVDTGILVFGAAEALAIVAVFLHGWSPNSPFPLVAGFRFVGVALSYELLSMFVLIGAALPARSLSIGEIVASQHGLWNVVRQPLGLPLFLVVALGVTFAGPLDVVDPADLATGGAADDSGVHRLAWGIARAAMVVTFAVAAAAVFLGGWEGPLLPGGLWIAVKAAAVGVVLVAARHLVARVPPERFVRLAWTVLLPLAFADLLEAGLVAL